MRNRFMYHQTGLPGWARFGTSPGWCGRGMGRGMGFRGQCLNYDNPDVLRQRAALLEAELAAIRSQLESTPSGGTQ